MRPRCFLFQAVLVSALVLSGGAVTFAAGKADALLGLVPPNSSVTLALEDLSPHAKAIKNSRLGRTIQNLPVVKRWLESDDFDEARASMEEVEALLKVDLPTLADLLLGKAVVLSLQLPPEGEAGEPKGLLLMEIGDRPLIDKLIQRVNSAQKETGELVEVRDSQYQGVTYTSRIFEAGGKSPEWYAILANNTFAWSNSESAIREVIERQGKGKGLAGQPAFNAVRSHLPSASIISLFVDPRSVERFLDASPPPQKSEEIRVLALVSGYLKALKYAGASIEWKEGMVVHVEEAVDPEKLLPDLKRWGTTNATKSDPTLGRVPPTALLMANVWIDPVSIVNILERFTTGDTPYRLKNVWVALDGLFLGLDTKTEVIPRVGPQVVGYVEQPESGADRQASWPTVLVIDLPNSGSEKLGQALVSGFRTILALTSLDEKKLAEHLQIETVKIAETDVTFLAPRRAIAFASGLNRFVIGSSPEAVARAFAAASDDKAGARFQALRASFMQGEGSFACVDLRSLHTFASQNRAMLAQRFASRRGRPELDVARDLNQVLDLIALFDAAYVTSQIEPGFARVHRTAGLLSAASPAP